MTREERDRIDVEASNLTAAVIEGKFPRNKAGESLAWSMAIGAKDLISALDGVEQENTALKRAVVLLKEFQSGLCTKEMVTVLAGERDALKALIAEAVEFVGRAEGPPCLCCRSWPEWHIPDCRLSAWLSKVKP